MNKTKLRIKELEEEIKEFFTCPHCGKKLKLYQECKHNKNPKIFQIVDEPLELKTELQATKQTLKEVEEVVEKVKKSCDKWSRDDNFDRGAIEGMLKFYDKLKKEVGLEEK